MSRKLFFIIFFSSFLFADAHIFLLHRFDDARYPSTSISTKKLREDFQYLKDNKYKVVSLDYLLSHLDEKKLVAFTIDDGYKSFYEKGFKLFREFNYPFTIFIYTEAIEKKYPDFMNWTQIRRVSQFGTIGLHSYSYPHLTKLTPIDVMLDTQKAITIFKKKLGELPKYYAYPFGEYNKESKEIISAFGFEAIFNQSMGAVSKESDLNNLYRITLIGEHNIATKLKVKYLPAKWIFPTEYPYNNILKQVIVKISKDIHIAQLYISGFNWQKVQVNNGLINLVFKEPLKLKYMRTRIFVKTFDNRISSHIIVK